MAGTEQPEDRDIRDLGVLRAAFDTAHVGMVVVDADDGSVSWANPAAESLLDCALPAGMPFGFPTGGESSITTIGGTTISLRSSSGRCGDRPVHVLLLVDVSDDRRAIRELTQAANTDPLTGLLHRRGLLDLIELDRPNLARPATLFIDLDDFKEINDVNGHEVGDVVLQAVAHRLQNVLRAGDRLARWGGDEFVMVTTGAAAAARLVGRTTAALSDPITYPGGSTVVHATIGWAAAARADWDFAELVNRADEEMYRRKHAFTEIDERRGHGGTPVVDVRSHHPSTYS